MKFKSIGIAPFFTNGVNALESDGLSNKNKDNTSLIIAWLVELFISITRDTG